MSVCITTSGFQMIYVPPPGPPINLTASTSPGQNSLSWSAAANQPGTSIAKYIVYRNDSGNWPPIGTATSTSFVDTAVQPLVTYSYYVIAVDSRGAVSTQSNQVSIVTSGPLPVAPTLSVTGTSTTTASLSWTTVATAVSYNLYRNGARVDSGLTGTSITDTGLSASTTYSYNVTAVNGVGEGPQSNTANATTAASGGTAVKWNPGHWVESDTVLGTGGTLSQIQSEIDAAAAQPNIVGYMIIAGWGMFQQAANTYTFSAFQTIVNYIKSKGLRWCVQVVAGDFNYGSTAPTSASSSFVPAYINNGNTSQWGTAGTRAGGVTTVLSGQSGWWGGDGNGNTYAAALWRPNVMAEWIKLAQAFATQYDSDASFEGYYQGEDSFYQGTGSQNNSDYNDVTQLNNWKTYLTACCTAFVTSNVWFSETFMEFQAQSIALTNFITDGTFPNHPPVLSQTDSLGAVQRSAIHTWGTQTYTGALGTLGDRRSTLRFVAEVQAPDLGFFQNLGSPREDIKAGLDIMKATHVFWVIVPKPTHLSNTAANKYPATFASVASNGLSATLASPWPLTSGTYDIVTSAGGHMTATRGSSAVTFTVAQVTSMTTASIAVPLIPFNWSNGGTSASGTYNASTNPTGNGTDMAYTDAGLLAWINDPANALQNTGYPPGYP